MSHVMRALCVLTILSAGLIAVSVRPVAAAEGDWKLIWHDEFDKDGPPDPANWDYERGFVRNNELQWYQPENATCKNGILTIEARKERKPNPNPPRSGSRRGSRSEIEVTSACLITRRKHEFTYGKFEMRARIDTRLGSWPAFWTLGVGRVGWPECGEIDIMEYYTGTVLANVCHGFKGQQKWLTTKKPLKELGGQTWAQRFHIWTMEWDRDHIDLLLDGDRRAHFNVADDDEPGKDNAFRKPHYILLNQAIGGTSGGDPSRLDYPARLEVDWVARVPARAARPLISRIVSDRYGRPISPARRPARPRRSRGRYRRPGGRAAR